jgi:hypothetical protein
MFEKYAQRGIVISVLYGDDTTTIFVEEGHSNVANSSKDFADARCFEWMSGVGDSALGQLASVWAGDGDAFGGEPKQLEWPVPGDHPFQRLHRG